jgi:preprotein translocase subunit SecY
MKKLIETFRNIFKIQELRNRIFFTLLLLAAFRFGSFVILPGIDSKTLEALFAQQQGSGILALINTFVGGAFSRGSIFALGIMPYISASIIVQLAGTVLPTIAKLQREGESGIRKINQLTRYLSVLITGVQAAAYVVNLQQYKQAIVADPWQFWLTTVFVLTAGTMFLVWMGERITDNGIGNGVSLLIAVGIIADLPVALITEWQNSPLMIFFAEIVALAAVIMLVILLTEGTRRIPVNYARRMVGAKVSGGMTPSVRQYIPLKLNAAGVMPIIFAQAIMFIPATVAQFFPESEFWAGTGSWFNDFKSIPYNLIFVTLIILFTYFYTAIAVNPNDIAENLKRQGGFIPGVKPGTATSEYIDEILTRITLPGSIFLAIIAILPAIVGSLGVSQPFALFFGGTSLLIMIGVVLDTLRQIESHLLMRHYDGLMKSGRVRSKARAMAGGGESPVSYDTV